MSASAPYCLDALGPAHAAAYAQVLAALHGEAFPEAPWGAQAMASALGQPGAFGFVARERADTDAKPLGFVLMRAVADEAEVLTIATRPAARRQGVGRALMRAALDHAHRLGAGRVFLEVAVSNVSAQGLYEGLGFAQVGRRKDYYARPGSAAASPMREDALVLARDL